MSVQDGLGGGRWPSSPFECCSLPSRVWVRAECRLAFLGHRGQHPSPRPPMLWCFLPGIDDFSFLLVSGRGCGGGGALVAFLLWEGFFIGLFLLFLSRV